jgi:hypothetical protein
MAFRLTDSVTIEELGERLMRRFFEVSAKSFNTYVANFSYFTQGYFALIILINKSIN